VLITIIICIEFEKEEEYARGKKDREREAGEKLKAEVIKFNICVY
jgi:hypothetical protein